MEKRTVLIQGISLCFKLELKQLLMLFDQIGVTDAHLWNAWKTALIKMGDRSYVNDFEYLQDQGHIIELAVPNIDEENQLHFNETYRIMSDKLRLLGEENKINQTLKWMTDNPNQTDICPELVRFGRYMNEARHCLARMHSIELNELCQLNTIPLVPSFSSLNINSQLESRRANVMHIILKRLPLPDNSVSLEDILQFRSDTQTQYFLSKIRNWASDTARGQLTPTEIEEKIEWLLAEYEHHLLINQIKTKRAVVEVVLTESLEAAENLFKLKWSNVSKQLFSLQNKKIEQLEVQTQAPGNEVAFISKVQKHFEKK